MYQNDSNRALGALSAQLAEILKPLDDKMLAEASEEDAESRRVLTEVSDLIILARQQGMIP